MESGVRWRKRLLRWVKAVALVAGLCVMSSPVWAGSVDPQNGGSGSDPQDGETCIETVQDWIEEGDGHFIDWNGHGKCRSDSSRTERKKPEAVVSDTLKDLETWLLSVLGITDRPE